MSRFPFERTRCSKTSRESCAGTVVPLGGWVGRGESDHIKDAGEPGAGGEECQ